MAAKTSPQLFGFFFIVIFFLFLLVSGSMSPELGFLIAMSGLVLLFWHNSLPHDVTLREAMSIAQGLITWRQQQGWEPSGKVRVMSEAEMKWIVLQTETEKGKESRYGSEFSKFKYDIGIAIHGDRTYGRLVKIGIKGDEMGVTRIRVPTSWSIEETPSVTVIKARKKKEEVFDQRSGQYRE